MNAASLLALLAVTAAGARAALPDPATLEDVQAAWSPAGLAALSLTDGDAVTASWAADSGDVAGVEILPSFHSTKATYHDDDGVTGAPYLKVPSAAGLRISANLFCSTCIPMVLRVRFRLPTAGQSGHLIGTSSLTAAPVDYGLGLALVSGKLVAKATYGSGISATWPDALAANTWYEATMTVSAALDYISLKVDQGAKVSSGGSGVIYPYTQSSIGKAIGSSASGNAFPTALDVSHLIVQKWEDDSIDLVYGDSLMPTIFSHVALRDAYGPEGWADGLADGAVASSWASAADGESITATAGSLVYRADDGSGSPYLDTTGGVAATLSKNSFCQSCVPMTAVVRFRLPDLGSGPDLNGHLVGTASSTAVPAGYGIGFGLVSGRLFAQSMSESSGIFLQSEEGLVTDGEWHTAIFTIEAAHGAVAPARLVVDGVEVASTTVQASNSYPYVRSTAGAADGSATGVRAHQLHGHVSHIAVLNQALTVEELGIVTCDADQPRLDASASGEYDGNLQLRWEAASDFSSVTWAFLGESGATPCDNAGASTGGWTHAAGAGCTRHTMSMPVTQVLSECGFSRLDDDTEAAHFVYEGVAEATAARATGEQVFGVDVTRTTRSAFRVRMRVPKSAQATAGAMAYPPVISFAQVSTQEVNPSTGAFSWGLATSVQWPYYLEALPAASATANFDEVAPAVTGGGTCTDAGADQPCTQVFTVAGTADTGVCSLGGTMTVQFHVRCRASFGGACDAPSPGPADATFEYATASYCAQVAEVATVVPTLTTYTGGDPDTTGVLSVDFITQTTLNGRVSLELEGGVAVEAVRLTRLDIVSGGLATADQTVTAVLDGDYSGGSVAAFGMSADGGGAAGLGNEDGRALVDFSLVLNDQSVTFSDGGVASVTLEATVSVTYTEAGSQATRTRLVRVMSTPSRASDSVRASASVAVGSAGGAAPPSSSSSSSASGFASVATVGVGAAALVAIVAVAAVATGARRRRQRRAAAAAASAKLSSSASAALAGTELVPSSSSGALPLDAALDLRTVQDVYGQTSQ